MAYSMVNLLRKSGSALAASFLAASLTSFAPVPDPSLLAAPDYEPELWNDVSNENLSIYYARHRGMIEAIVGESVKNPPHDIALTFPRKAHVHDEKALYAIRYLNRYIADNAAFRTTELGYSLSVHFNIPVYQSIAALIDAKKIYKPLGVAETNNCYAYSVNDRDPADAKKTYQAGPGERTRGRAAFAISGMIASNYKAYIRQTIEGNISDGMIFTGQEMKSRKGYYRAALYMRPARHDTDNPLEAIEYHYARQNRDGTWSHKYGPLNVTNIDYGGHLMRDAAKADMGDYKFIGYFLVPQGGLDVGPASEKATRTASRPGLIEPRVAG